MNGKVAALWAVLLLLPVTCAAQGRLFESDFDDENRPWKEIEARLPAHPRPENLIAFDAGAATPHRFFIDAPSVSVGEDGVVRYTLVIRTAGGATNVSFEGIRCETREQKTYAIGRPDGSWARARDPRWRRIEHQDINRHHAALYRDYFCDGRSPVRRAADALDALKYGGLRSN